MCLSALYKLWKKVPPFETLFIQKNWEKIHFYRDGEFYKLQIQPSQAHSTLFYNVSHRSSPFTPLFQSSSEKSYTHHKGHRKVTKFTAVSAASWLILHNETTPRIDIASSICTHITGPWPLPPLTAILEVFSSSPTIADCVSQCVLQINLISIVNFCTV